MNQTAIFDQFWPREFTYLWILWRPSLVIHGLKLTQITFIMILFTIGSSIHNYTCEKIWTFFFRSGDILTIGGSQFEQNIWAIVFCTLICPVIWNSHIFFWFTVYVETKHFLIVLLVWMGKKILRYNNFCINMVTWLVAQILL